MKPAAKEIDWLDHLNDVMAVAGEQLYGYEAVSQLAHGLQCAAYAETEGASPDLIAAALLHDVGHLVDKHFERGQVNAVDRRHEAIGAAYLARAFPPSVTEPIRLHVAAKRYLCAVDDGYLATLSPASVRSLELQGGPYTAAEAETFIAQPYADDAVRLRRWDDLAKDPAAVTPPLAHLMTYVEQSRTA